MGTKEKQSAAPLAPNWVAPDAPGAIPIPPELKARPERAYVVNASNAPAPWSMLAVVLAADIVLGAFTFLALHYLGNVDGLLSFLLAIAGVTGIALAALALLSGDVPALYEIRKAARVDLKRVEAIRDISMGWVGVAREQAAAQRAEAEARLLEIRLDDKRLALALAEKPQAQSLANRLDTYTPAEPPPDTLREDMKAWIGAAVDDPQIVDAAGKFLAAVPWSAKGRLSKSDRERVLAWLRTVNNAAPRGWVLDMRDNAWRVNVAAYPTAAEVVAQLASWPMPAK